MDNKALAQSISKSDVRSTRLLLRIPGVEPETYLPPQRCPYNDCSGRQFKPHQEDCPKSLRDPSLSLVKAQRLRCVECNRTFRVYPPGVTRNQQSETLRKLSVLLYMLGMSYGGVSEALGALHWFLGKTTVYYNVCQTGDDVQKIRQNWLACKLETVRSQGPKSIEMQPKGGPIALVVAANEPVGAELTVDILDRESASTIVERLRQMAKIAGAEISVGDTTPSQASL
ncbi:MAG: hypothetical protein HYY30_00085 [Chloroflexi bacterium]|nr:hypothetical protein [Chloroflexota bacterium]